MRLELGNLALYLGRRMNKIKGSWPHRTVASDCGNIHIRGHLLNLCLENVYLKMYENTPNTVIKYKYTALNLVKYKYTVFVFANTNAVKPLM